MQLFKDVFETPFYDLLKSCLACRLQKHRFRTCHVQVWKLENRVPR